MELTAKRNKIKIAIIYRPPKQQAADETELYDEVKSVIQNKQAVIIGDFNCPNIDWATMNGDQCSATKSQKPQNYVFFIINNY